MDELFEFRVEACFGWTSWTGVLSVERVEIVAALGGRCGYATFIASPVQRPWANMTVVKHNWWLAFRSGVFTYRKANRNWYTFECRVCSEISFDILQAFHAEKGAKFEINQSDVVFFKVWISLWIVWFKDWFSKKARNLNWPFILNGIMGMFWKKARNLNSVSKNAWNFALDLNL